jgi:hypothetical protein
MSKQSSTYQNNLDLAWAVYVFAIHNLPDPKVLKSVGPSCMHGFKFAKRSQVES